MSLNVYAYRSWVISNLVIFQWRIKKFSEGVSDSSQFQPSCKSKTKKKVTEQFQRQKYEVSPVESPNIIHYV